MPERDEDRHVNFETVPVENSDDVNADGKAWPPVMETKDAGFESGDDVEVKDASGGDIAVNVEETDNPFRFRVIGGVTGIKDRVNDVVEPGAYTKTLKTRTPKIIKDHEWSQRLGKVLSIKELHPGDPDLPATTADGSAWPKDAGALVADVQLFKKSQAGQEAAERWREYGRDQQFSIGYRVPTGMAVKSKDGVRHIKEVDLYEISDVLWGAAPDSTLLPSVLATKVLAGVEFESKGDPDDDEDVESDDAVTVEEPVETVESVDAETEDEDEDNAAPPVIAEPFDDDDADFDIEEIDFDDPSIDAEAFDTFGDEIAATVTSDVERGDDPETAAPSTEDAGTVTADTVTDPDPGEGDAPDNDATDAVVDGNVGPRDGAPEDAAPGTDEAEKTLGPIESHVDLRGALRVYEATPDGDRAVLAAYIASKADAAGIDFLVPDDVRKLAGDYAAKYDTTPLGTGNNFVTQGGGFDPFIRATAHALIRNGHSKSQAIALAIGAMKRWASGKGNVDPKTRAKAVKALAGWEKLKAKAAAKRAAKTGVAATKADDVWEEATGHAERKAMTVPFFAGSNEEMRCLIQDALNDSWQLGQFEGRPSIIGTFDSYVIVTVWPELASYAGGDIGYPSSMSNETSTYKVDFDYNPDDGSVDLGQVQAIRITTKPATDTADPTDVVAEVLGGMDNSTGTDSVKHAVDMLSVETKAGRVLSAANAEALKEAYLSLGDLLERAGVDVNNPDDTTDDTGDGDVIDNADEPDVTGEKADDESEAEFQRKILQLMQIRQAVRDRTLSS